MQSVEDEKDTPVRIGAGSFATVFVVSGGPVAFKEVSVPTNGPALLSEYESLKAIYDTCNSTSFFSIPRALAFNDPLSLSGFMTSSPSPPSARRRRPERPIVTPHLFSPFSRAAYAMDRVFALPPAVRLFLRQTFLPSNAEVGPALCRLYLGKDYRNAPPSRFHNSQNYPLDEHRYNRMAAQFTSLPPVTEVARGMGETLGRMHSLAGIDGRDIEFVLGGNGYGEFNFFVIDFNQVRKWVKAQETIGELVSAFFANDPYYPRPRPSNELYQEFKKAYLAEYPPTLVPLGEAFLEAIEGEQSTRDSRAAAASSA